MWPPNKVSKQKVKNNLELAGNHTESELYLHQVSAIVCILLYLEIIIFAKISLDGQTVAFEVLQYQEKVCLIALTGHLR